ncbi:addiction module protein [Georgenia sp. TF02-10]|uniref:addiction module protein n=1 Tax=Georgenia sp. TF02-10 TaxID=2917725 RepID=UPI001FA74BA8|nr:addiction module protein [Georgenia sp. TF02-10]UNX55226.1 addiction module protein [Georgenia sp. TF02-10]
MNPELAAYIEAGYRLTPGERLVAARMLRLSVDRDAETGPADIDAEWDAVVDRRAEEVFSGAVQPVSGQESFAWIHARLDALHR